MKEKSSLLRRLVPLLLLAVLIPLVMWLSARGLNGQADSESLRLAEQSIRRAAVQCYALEGFYPAELDYLEENYGVSVNRDKYFVDYQYLAANLMPDVTVLPLSS